MPYTFLHIEKINNTQRPALVSKYNHNCRVAHPANVIAELSSKNTEPVPLPKDNNGEQMNYYDAVINRIKNLDYYKTHPIRKNNNLAYEVIMTYTRDDSVDDAEWEKRSIEWLHKTFDVAPDKQSNIIHAICHRDEPGNIHIHAIVTPVDDKGHLNVKYFTNGSRAMSELQSSYAESVADLGLERGISGSSARHKDIRKYYAELNRTKEALPVPKEGELASDYLSRANEELEAMYISNKRRMDEYSINARRKVDKERAEQYEAIKKEFEQSEYESNLYQNALLQKIEDEKNKMDSEYMKSRKRLDSVSSDLLNLTEKLNATRDELAEAENVQDAVAFYSRFSKDMEIISEYNPEYAEQIEQTLDEMHEEASYLEEKNASASSEISGQGDIDEVDIVESEL